MTILYTSALLEEPCDILMKVASRAIDIVLPLVAEYAQHLGTFPEVFGRIGLLVSQEQVLGVGTKDVFPASITAVPHYC